MGRIIMKKSLELINKIKSFMETFDYTNTVENDDPDHPKMLSFLKNNAIRTPNPTFKFQNNYTLKDPGTNGLTHTFTHSTLPDDNSGITGQYGSLDHLRNLSTGNNPAPDNFPKDNFKPPAFKPLKPTTNV